MLSNLLKALKNDPDLATLPENKLGKTLFICSGCDYTSYFSGHGKATILNVFFQHAEFINGVQMPGCLSETSTTNKKSGFLSFIRLVGTLYISKNIFQPLSPFMALTLPTNCSTHSSTPVYHLTKNINIG